MKSVSCLLVVLSVVEYISAAKLPKYIKICHQSDPDLNSCVMNAFEEIRPKLLEGIPELDVPPMDMIKIDDIIIDRGTGQYGLKLNLTNVQLQGASELMLTKLKVDVPNMIYKMSLTFPKLRITGDYAVDTKILSLPIKSEGHFDANATNTEGVGILKGTLVTDKFKHLYFTDLNINLNIGDYNLRLDNVIKGDGALNDAINELVNTNKDELIIISTPFIEKRASIALLKIANQIVQNLEYDKVFPM